VVAVGRTDRGSLVSVSLCRERAPSATTTERWGLRGRQLGDAAGPATQMVNFRRQL